MSRIADPLRELAHDMYKIGTIGLAERNSLLIIADEIDHNHERRMDQARSDMRKAACRYMARVVEDYKHGRKWQRKDGEKCAR